MQQPSQKKPRYVPGPEPDAGFPSWRIGLLEMVDPFGWHAIERSTLDSVRLRLGNLESMTWHEILKKNDSHNIKKTKLCPAAQKRLAILKQDDIDEVFSLRLSGKERVWGIREGEALKVLWWDPEHLICPSPKKHT